METLKTFIMTFFEQESKQPDCEKETEQPENEQMVHKCSTCHKLYDDNVNHNWWIDDLYTVYERDGDRNKYYDLCFECRSKIAKETCIGTAKCSRCWKSGDWGIGKWNTNQGHLECYAHSERLMGLVFCYDCHGKIHYNK